MHASLLVFSFFLLVNNQKGGRINKKKIKGMATCHVSHALSTIEIDTWMHVHVYVPPYHTITVFNFKSLINSMHPPSHTTPP